MTQNGKGDKPRPKSVSRKTFAENWDRIFKKEIVTAEADESYVNKRENVDFSAIDTKPRINHGDTPALGDDRK